MARTGFTDAREQLIRPEVRRAPGGAAALNALPISVVIPAYQAENFVARAVAAARSQTSPPAEILVVDDGSTDRTAEYATAAGARVIRQPNGGVAAARNAGIRDAREPWIAFLDADDSWQPDKLRAQWAAHLERPHAPMIFCDYALVRGTKRLSESALGTMAHYRRAPHSRVSEDVVSIAPAAACDMFAQGGVFSSSTLLASRAWILERNLWYASDLPADPSFLIAEDLEWLLRASRNDELLVVEENLADYIWHSAGRSAARGRQAMGALALQPLLAAQPERYVAGAAAAFAGARPAQLRHAGMEYLRDLEYPAAARTFARALALRPAARDLALYALAQLGRLRAGRVAVESARSLWRRRIKPPYRPKRCG